MTRYYVRLQERDTPGSSEVVFHDRKARKSAPGVITFHALTAQTERVRPREAEIQAGETALGMALLDLSKISFQADRSKFPLSKGAKKPRNWSIRHSIAKPRILTLLNAHFPDAEATFNEAVVHSILGHLNRVEHNISVEGSSKVGTTTFRSKFDVNPDIRVPRWIEEEFHRDVKISDHPAMRIQAQETLTGNHYVLFFKGTYRGEKVERLFLLLVNEGGVTKKTANRLKQFGSGVWIYNGRGCEGKRKIIPPKIPIHSVINTISDVPNANLFI